MTHRTAVKCPSGTKVAKKGQKVIKLEKVIKVESVSIRKKYRDTFQNSQGNFKKMYLLNFSFGVNKDDLLNC